MLHSKMDNVDMRGGGDSCCLQMIYDYYSHVSMSYYLDFPQSNPPKQSIIFEVQCG